MMQRASSPSVISLRARLPNRQRKTPVLPGVQTEDKVQGFSLDFAFFFAAGTRLFFVIDAPRNDVIMYK